MPLLILWLFFFGMFYKNLSRFDNMGFCCEGFPFGLLEAMVCFGEWRLLDLYHALTDLV